MRNKGKKGKILYDIDMTWGYLLLLMGDGKSKAKATSTTLLPYPTSLHHHYFTLFIIHIHINIRHSLKAENKLGRPTTLPPHYPQSHSLTLLYMCINILPISISISIGEEEIRGEGAWEFQSLPLIPNQCSPLFNKP